MNKKAMVFAFLFIFVGFLGITAQMKDHEMIRLEKEAMRIQAEAVTSGYIIYVDATIGNDTTGTGSAKKPFKTINRALSAARSGDTIKVSPGVYSENLYIDTLDRITFEGAGSDVCILSGYLYTLGCKYLGITGLKFTGSEAWGTCLWCDNTDVAVVRDCVFAILGGTGIILEHNSAMWVYNSQLSCTDGSGALSHSFSYLYLQNCTVTENWIGIIARRGALAYADNCTISNNSGQGAWIHQNAEFWIGTSSFSNNDVGIWLESGATLNGNRTGASNTIFNNATFGIWLSSGSNAELYCTEIYNNGTGIYAEKASVLDIRRDNNIYGNSIGIEVTEFAHAFLRNTPIRGNTLWDVNIHTGGQAICDPSDIGNLQSDCPYCQ